MQGSYYQAEWIIEIFYDWRIANLDYVERLKRMGTVLALLDSSPTEQALRAYIEALGFDLEIDEELQLVKHWIAAWYGLGLFEVRDRWPDSIVDSFHPAYFDTMVNQELQRMKKDLKLQAKRLESVVKLGVVYRYISDANLV